MAIAALLICALPRAPRVDKTTLEYYQQNFVIRTKKTVLRVPMRQDSPKPALFVDFRRNKNFAVWDDRGLTVRSGKWVHSTRLSEIAVSPKAFQRDEILETLRLVKAGKRSKDADALSGCRRLGSEAFFLVRWDEKNGQPWCEALVEVNLADARPKPKFLGRIEGSSLATKPLDDVLQVDEGRLLTITRRGEDWGAALYDLKSRSFSFQPLGGPLLSYLRPNLAIEKSPYGSQYALAVDLAALHTELLYENRGGMRFIDAQQPRILTVRAGSETRLHNCETGAETVLPASAAVRRAGSYLLVWTPYDQPRHAVLYDTVGWSKLSEWNAKQ